MDHDKERCAPSAPLPGWLHYLGTTTLAPMPIHLEGIIQTCQDTGPPLECEGPSSVNAFLGMELDYVYDMHSPRVIFHRKWKWTLIWDGSLGNLAPLWGLWCLMHLPLCPKQIMQGQRANFRGQGWYQWSCINWHRNLAGNPCTIPLTSTLSWWSPNSAFLLVRNIFHIQQVCTATGYFTTLALGVKEVAIQQPTTQLDHLTTGSYIRPNNGRYKISNICYIPQVWFEVGWPKDEWGVKLQWINSQQAWY